MNKDSEIKMFITVGRLQDVEEKLNKALDLIVTLNRAIDELGNESAGVHFEVVQDTDK